MILLSLHHDLSFSHLSFSIVSPLAHFFTSFSNEWYISRMGGVWRLLSFTLSVIQFNHNLKVQLYLVTLFVSNCIQLYIQLRCTHKSQNFYTRLQPNVDPL